MLVIWQSRMSSRVDVARTTAGLTLLLARSVNGKGTTTTSPATNRATPHPPRQSPNPATKTWRPKEAGWHGRPDQNLHLSRLRCCAWAKHTAHGLLPQTRIQILAGGVTVGQFANCPTVSESGRDADGKQRAGPDPSAEGQAAADAGEAGLRGYGEPKRSVDSRRQLPDADDFPSLGQWCQLHLPPSGVMSKVKM